MYLALGRASCIFSLSGEPAHQPFEHRLPLFMAVAGVALSSSCSPSPRLHSFVRLTADGMQNMH